VRRFTIRMDFRSKISYLFIICTIGLSANVIVRYEKITRGGIPEHEIASKELIKGADRLHAIFAGKIPSFISVQIFPSLIIILPKVFQVSKNWSCIFLPSRTMSLLEMELGRWIF